MNGVCGQASFPDIRSTVNVHVDTCAPIVLYVVGLIYAIITEADERISMPKQHTAINDHTGYPVTKAKPTRFYYCRYQLGLLQYTSKLLWDHLITGLTI